MVARDDELSLLKPDSAQLVSADRPASREAINNRSATDLMNTAFNDRDPRAAARRYVDVHTYIQHNPNFANGREAQIVGMEAMVNQFPPCSIEVRRTVAQGDLVVVPAGKKHNFVNTGENPLILYTVYGPPEHADGAVHKTKEEADRLEEEGKDEPPTS